MQRVNNYVKKAYIDHENKTVVVRKYVIIVRNLMASGLLHANDDVLSLPSLSSLFLFPLSSFTFVVLRRLFAW